MKETVPSLKGNEHIIIVQGPVRITFAISLPISPAILGSTFSQVAVSPLDHLEIDQTSSPDYPQLLVVNHWVACLEADYLVE
jgi:hypothetical protein